jgi:iron complex outermembrane receptor protein
MPWHRCVVSLAVFLALGPTMSEARQAPQNPADPAGPKPASPEPASAPIDPAELERMSLEEILGIDVAAATKTSVPLAKSPVSVRVITHEEIARSAARTLPDLLRRVAGVDVRWNPMVPVMTIRGFGQLPFSSRVLFLVDGVPQNSANKGGFRAHPVAQPFDLQNVERIEVIRGPGAALYGENAFWGVINIVTFDGDDLEGGRVELMAGARDSYSGALRWGGLVGKASLFASASLARTSFPMEFWLEGPSRIDADNLLLKGKYGGWRLSYQRYSDEIEAFREQLGASLFRSADPLEQRVDLAALSYDGTVAGGRVTLAGNLSHTRRDGMFCGSCHAFNQRPEFSRRAHGENETLGELRASFAPVASHRVLLGVEGKSAQAGTRALEMLSPAAAGVSSFDYDKLAVYAQDELSLADDRVRITAGLRYDGAAGDLFDDEVSPRLAVVWTASPKATVRANWGTAFRFPSLTERYQASWWLTLQTASGPRPVVVFVPNPGLEPEEIRTFELGGELRPRRDLDLSAHLFQSRVSRMVVVALDRRTVPNTDTFANHPQQATITGGELEARWRPRQGIDAFLTGSFADTERDGTGVDVAGRPLELTYAPELHATAGIAAGPYRGWSGALEATWKDDSLVPEFWTPITGLTTVESYALVDARLSWAPPLPGGRWRLSLYGTDLFDEAPRETVVGVDTSLPGREYWLALEVGF